MASPSVALCKAKTSGQVIMLLEGGADIDGRSRCGRTALSCVVGGIGYDFSTQRSAFQELLDRGADPNIADDAGKTPLHYARITMTINLLVDAGADVNARRANGETCLFAATVLSPSYGAPLIRTLIERGADPQIATESGSTPLHMAKSAEIVNLFVAHGAKLDVKDKDGATPIDGCSQHSGALEALLKHVSDAAERAEVARQEAAAADPSRRIKAARAT